MKPKHQRLLFISVSLLFLCISAVLILRAFKDNIVFFYSPSELAEQSLPASQRLRIGGLVETGSIKREQEDRIRFIVTDGAKSIEVTYKGLLPNLFREGQGVVAEGYLTDARHFDAKTILAKHDESYMPREVVDALKRSGRWQEGKTPVQK
jgi:cytochrome c-type biogenesis protein CcmE